MDIQKIYDNKEQINIQTYLEKCNVKDIEEYLQPSGKYIESHYKYEDMCYACNEILYWRNIEDSKIMIIQDGDCDGVCSTVILYQYLKALRNDWDITILLHTSKQRGLDDEDIMNKIRDVRPHLVIIPDAGTNNKEQANELCELGIGLIVLDHHEIKTPITKGILINNQNEEYAVQRNGSGALVTHKLLQALDEKLNVNWSAYLIDLVALSLLSDSMDMSEMENREYYYYGLQNIDVVINEFLIKLFEKFIGDKEYTQKDISFKIVPKINSVCRHKDMEYKKKLLLAFIGQEDYSEILDIVEQAHKDQINTVNEIISLNLGKIEEITDNNLIIFSSDDIPRSYSGLVCGKIMNLCGNKPSIVGSIKDNYFIGSLRSPIPLMEELSNNKLVDFAQGHECSCGIGIKEENIQSLIDYYNTVDLNYVPYETVLNSYSIKSIPKHLFGLFEQYNALWGKGIDKPLFHINNIKFKPTDIQIMGKTKRTLKLNIDGIDIMIFFCLKEDKENLKLGYYDEFGEFNYKPSNETLVMECIGELSINEWNGNKKPQIIVDKFEISCYNKKSKDDIF